jgi:hypothetical protein
MTVRRIVLLTLAEGTTPADVDAMSAAIDGFLSKLSFVTSSSYGPDLALGAPGGRARYALVVDLACAADVDRYEQHPDHAAVRSVLAPFVVGKLTTDTELDSSGSPD